MGQIRGCTCGHPGAGCYCPNSNWVPEPDPVRVSSPTKPEKSKIVLSSVEIPPPPPGHPCHVCGKTDDQKAMAFVGEDWCCDQHRKVLIGEL